MNQPYQSSGLPREGVNQPYQSSDLPREGVNQPYQSFGLPRDSYYGYKDSSGDQGRTFNFREVKRGKER